MIGLPIIPLPVGSSLWDQLPHLLNKRVELSYCQSSFLLTFCGSLHDLVHHVICLCRFAFPHLQALELKKTLGGHVVKLLQRKVEICFPSTYSAFACTFSSWHPLNQS